MGGREVATSFGMNDHSFISHVGTCGGSSLHRQSNAEDSRRGHETGRDLHLRTKGCLDVRREGGGGGSVEPGSCNLL